MPTAVNQIGCIVTHCLWHRGSLMQQATCVCALDQSHSAQSNASLSGVWGHLLSGSHSRVKKMHIPVTKEILYIKKLQYSYKQSKFMDIFHEKFTKLHLVHLILNICVHWHRYCMSRHFQIILYGSWVNYLFIYFLALLCSGK